MHLGNVSQCLHNGGKRDVATRQKGETVTYIEALWGVKSPTHSGATAHALSVPRARTPHLCFSLLQEGLQPLLGGPSLVVVAHYQDDVVPVELAHQVEPNVRLVGIRRDCAQKGQMDALRSAEQEVEINLLTFGISVISFLDESLKTPQADDFFLFQQNRWSQEVFVE